MFEIHITDKGLVFLLTSKQQQNLNTVVKEISLEYSLEGLMLKLKLQYLATWHEELTHLKRPCCSERLKAGGEGDNSGWDGWMASPTPWTWVWVDSRSWWWTGRPGMLQFMGAQRVGHDWATELNWTELTGQTFVGKVISLLFNMLSSLVITFLPRSKRFLI